MRKNLKIGALISALASLVTIYIFITGNATINDTSSQTKNVTKIEVILFNNTDRNIDYIMNSRNFTLSSYSKKIHEDENGNFWLKFKGDINDNSYLNYKLTKSSYEFYWSVENEIIDIQPIH